ncbi:hypothetical protein ACJMK2_032627 [Sinanodonta woodiana]|uniref:Acid ceramidase n=1 Tax=Sinanodonta woodiana TaxID=1069815 RepID=A0ABD3X4H4_SINWO
MLSVVFASFTFILFAEVSCQVPPYNETCVRGSYPPPASQKVPWYTINLDDPPITRWEQVGKDKKGEINFLLFKFKQFILELSSTIGALIIQELDNLGPKLDSMLPQPFADELKGMANSSGLQLGEIVLYNLFYEFFTVCTSIVAEDTTGKLYHGRNLDFGLFLGWNTQNKTWEITSALRPTIINIDWQKGGKTVFKSVNFAGYIGILTAVKPGIFTLSMNERFKLDGGYLGILEWLLGKRTGQWMGFLTRNTMESVNSFDEAIKVLANTEMLAPAYYIVGGNKSGEGCVITRNREVEGTDLWQMRSVGAGQWYILETNYDHWNKPLFLDDRRTPANRCMQNLTQQNVGISGIFDVLSSKPVLNKLTTYTALMQVNSGHLETWLQYCPDPCFPW